MGALVGALVRSLVGSIEGAFVELLLVSIYRQDTKRGLLERGEGLRKGCTREYRHTGVQAYRQTGVPYGNAGVRAEYESMRVREYSIYGGELVAFVTFTGTYVPLSRRSHMDLCSPAPPESVSSESDSILQETSDGYEPSLTASE